MAAIPLRLYRCMACGHYQHRMIPDDADVRCHRCNSPDLAMWCE